MSKPKTVDLPQMISNPSPISSIPRSKKLPPPPLCLPASTIDEEKLSNSNEQSKLTQNCCLSSSSSSKECPHKQIPYILPIAQRSQILETLIITSSTLLVPSLAETKQRKSQTSINSNQTNLLKQRHASKQGTVSDTEWIDFIRFLVHKPLENEVKILLDKYKMTYFDRVNAPNTTDATIRATLCDMVSQTLTTYSTNSSLLIVPNDIPIGIPSSLVPTRINNKSNSKRKRNDRSTNISESSTIVINNQTKFVISSIIPGQCDNTNNRNKIIYQQRHKQFQKKYTHLFKYVPDKDDQAYLIGEGHLKSVSVSSCRLSNNPTDNICLMLYDEVLAYMDEYDLESRGISIDNSFTLSEPILSHIYSNIQ